MKSAIRDGDKISEAKYFGEMTAYPMRAVLRHLGVELFEDFEEE